MYFHVCFKPKESERSGRTSKKLLFLWRLSTHPGYTQKQTFEDNLPIKHESVSRTFHCSLISINGINAIVTGKYKGEQKFKEYFFFSPIIPVTMTLMIVYS